MKFSKNSTLLLSGFSQCAIYYSYDIPGALNYKLDPKDMPSIEAQVATFYSAYSIPNIILPYCFSYALKFSRYKLILILSIFSFLGQSIFTYGIYTTSFRLMVLGRVLMGIGGESYSLIQNKIIGDNFKQEECRFLMAFYNSSAQLGPVLNYFLTPVISEYFSPISAVLVGTIFSFLSLFGCIIKYRFLTSTENLKSCLYTLEFLNYSDSKITIEDQKSVVLNKRRKSADNIGNYKQLSMHFKDLSAFSRKRKQKKFSSNFLIIALLCFILSLVFYPFCNVAPMMFQRNFKMESNTSSMLVGLIDAISLIFSFMISNLTHILVNKLTLSMIGTFFVGMAHSLFLLSNFNKPFLSIFILGSSIPFSSCFWYLLPSIIAEENLQQGCAILFCISNLAYSISPLIVALFTSRNSYFWVELYFLICLGIGLCLLILLNNRNKKLALGMNNVI